MQLVDGGFLAGGQWLVLQGCQQGQQVGGCAVWVCLFLWWSVEVGGKFGLNVRHSRVVILGHRRVMDTTMTYSRVEPTVAKECLNGGDVGSRIDQLCAKGVPEHMRCHLKA